MPTASHEQIDTVKSNIDAFMALSKIALAGMERLATLNLEATRTALEEGANAYSLMLHPGDKKAQPNLEAVTSAVDYFRNVQEIAVETQKEVTDLMTAHVALQGNGGNANAAWTKGFDLFKRFGDQVTNMTEANRKTVGDVTAQIVNAASSHPKRRA